MKCTKLTKRIVLQKQSDIRNEYGEIFNIWEDVATVWAQVRPVTGKSFFDAQQVNASITHQVIIRYRENVLPSMRVLFNNRSFDVLHVMNFDESNESIQLMCKELM